MYKCTCGHIFRVDHSAVKSGRIRRCKQCGCKKAPSCKIDFMINLRKRHGNKYNYDKFIYYKSTEYVTVTCPIHGDFNIMCKHHVVGNGCPQCANISRSIVLRKVVNMKKSYLYYVYFKELNLWKIGVTSNIAYRFNGELYKPIHLHIIPYPTGVQAYYIEDRLKELFNDLRYQGTKVLKRKGNTELLISSIPFVESVELIESTNEYKELVRKLVE